MTNREHTRSLGAVSTTRLEAFSDGVFAIATTLLVLEITVPRLGEDGNLFQSLADLWPSYVSYLVSFLTIGVIWVNHHFLIGLYQRVDRPLLFLNLGLLVVVAFIPFPTAVVAEYLVTGTPSQLSAAALLYGIVAMALTGMFTLLWLHTRRAIDSLRDAEASARVIAKAIRFCFISLGIYAVGILLALAVPVAALAVYLFVVLLYSFWRLSR
ncbi:MAG: TMEM175 family protein [Microbacteriaceae bacterium]